MKADASVRQLCEAFPNAEKVESRGDPLKHALARVDEGKLPAQLESSNPRNISLYERHGFETIGEIQIGNSPVVTPMLRPARQ